LLFIDNRLAWAVNESSIYIDCLIDCQVETCDVRIIKNIWSDNHMIIRDLYCHIFRSSYRLRLFFEKISSNIVIWQILSVSILIKTSAIITHKQLLYMQIHSMIDFLSIVLLSSDLVVVRKSKSSTAAQQHQKLFLCKDWVNEVSEWENELLWLKSRRWTTSVERACYVYVFEQRRFSESLSRQSSQSVNSTLSSRDV